MIKFSKSQLLLVIPVIVFASVALAWYFSQKPKQTTVNPEAQYYYAVPEPGKGSTPRHVKGG